MKPTKVWQSGWHKEKPHNWQQGPDRPGPKKKKPQGAGVTPAWVSGMAQLNI